jgi:adenine-specific DNA-methyltransferase
MLPSLIGWDVLDGQLFDDEQRKLNPLNFEDKFKAVMQEDGFDAIVGNPPYIRIQTLQETTPLSVDYLKKHYVSASKGNYDIYVAFVERALSLKP